MKEPQAALACRKCSQWGVVAVVAYCSAAFGLFGFMLGHGYGVRAEKEYIRKFCLAFASDVAVTDTMGNEYRFIGCFPSDAKRSGS